MGGRSVVLHIGLPKTGTSSIRRAVYDRRQYLLAEHRVLYPSLDINYSRPFMVMFRPNLLGRQWLLLTGVRNEKDVADLRTRYFGELEREIEGSDWDTLVFSGEGICGLRTPELIALRNWLRPYVDSFRIFFWVRHPVSFTASRTQQAIRDGRQLPDMYAQPPLPQFRSAAMPAIDVFGRDAVELTAFEDAVGEPGAVVAAFLRRLGLGEATALTCAASADDKNPSLSLLAVQILSSLNRQRPTVVQGELNPERREKHVELGVMRRIGGPPFRLDAEVRSRVRELARADVEWLNATFGTLHYLDVFDPEAAQVGEPETRLPDQTVDSLAIALSDLINQSAPRATVATGSDKPQPKTAANGQSSLLNAARDLVATATRSSLGE